MGTVVSTQTPTFPQKIGDGLYGVVYATGDNTVTKKQKVMAATLTPYTEAWRESRAFDWIDTITDPKMKSFFACRIRQIITHDTAWTHVPEFYNERMAVFDTATPEDQRWLTASGALLAERNAYQYVHEVVMERKGRPVQKNLATPAKINKAIVELLTVIHFMQRAGVVHTDMHAGNIVMQENGSIALIDYGDVYLSDDPEYGRRVEEHVMMSQFIGMCIDIHNNFDIEERLANAPEVIRSKVTTMEQRIDTALNTDGVQYFLTKVCDGLKYTDPVGKARAAPIKHDLVVCVLFDWMKLNHPSEFKKMMGWPATSELHSWIRVTDLEFIFMNMGDLPALIQYFKTV